MELSGIQRIRIIADFCLLPPSLRNQSDDILAVFFIGRINRFIYRPDTITAWPACWISTTREPSSYVQPGVSPSAGICANI